jgi:hypothetical protein
MTRQQVVTFSVVVATLISAGLIGWYLFIKGLGDSPVRVVGGSIELWDDKGWRQTYSPHNGCVSNMVDLCNYTSETFPTTAVTIENVTDVGGISYPVGHPKQIAVTGRWIINVFASKDDGTPDMNGVSLCTSGSGGNCDSGGRSNYVTIQRKGSYGFYPNETANKKHRYHNTANCPKQKCENMNRVEVFMNGSSTPDVYSCKASVGCKINIGPPL